MIRSIICKTTLCLWFLATGGAFGAEPLNVGAASNTINPPMGTFLGGYDHNRKSTGAHDDLFAKAVVFDDGKEAVALLVLDAISIQLFQTDEIRVAAVSKVGNAHLKAEHIVVQATHSHCTPDLTGLYGASPAESGLSPVYIAQMMEAAADAVARAWVSRRPATLLYAETICGDWAVNDSEAAKIDNSVTILECLDASGKAIATLTNFACHPTVLDGDTTLTSADWVGPYYRAMGGALPGEHLFLQGAIGAWIQPKTPERSFALAELYGRDLASKVTTVLHSAKALEGTAIRFSDKRFQMPLTNETFKQMTELGLTPRNMKGGSVETEVTWFSLGDAQFATHPGETAPMFAEETRSLMKSGPKFILGLGNDHLGYIIPPAYFDEPSKVKYADYLVSMSPGREAGPSMMAALKSIIP
jgi:hypothetical protein